MISSHFKTHSFCYNSEETLMLLFSLTLTNPSLSLLLLQNSQIGHSNPIFIYLYKWPFLENIYKFSTDPLDPQTPKPFEWFLALSVIYICMFWDSYARVGTLLRLSMSRQLNPTTRTAGLFPKLVVALTQLPPFLGEDGGGGLVARGVDGGGGATTRSSSWKSESLVKGLETLLGGDPVKNNSGVGSCSQPPPYK